MARRTKRLWTDEGKRSIGFQTTVAGISAALVRPSLDHGILGLGNNTAERAIRPVAIGRKNDLFVGAQTGAHLPLSRRTGDMERWDTPDLHSIINGDTMKEAFETLNQSIFPSFTEKRLKEKHTSIFGVLESSLGCLIILTALNLWGPIGITELGKQRRNHVIRGMRSSSATTTAHLSRSFQTECSNTILGTVKLSARKTQIRI